MKHDAAADVLSQKILIHGAVIEAASDRIGDHGDQDLVAGLLFSYYELRDTIKEKIKEVTGKDLF